MKNWVRTMALLLGITAMMMTPALAADYEFDAPDGGMYAPPTSVDQVIVVGGGVTESSNIDRSKNTAIIAPPFGSPESYQPGAGTVLIPQASTATGNTGGSDTVYLPPASYVDGTPTEDTSLSSTKFTLPDGLYYTDGSIGRLKIPVLGLSVKVYENESLENLAKGADRGNRLFKTRSDKRKYDHTDYLRSECAGDALVCPGPGNHLTTKLLL